MATIDWIPNDILKIIFSYTVCADPQRLDRAYWSKFMIGEFYNDLNAIVRTCKRWHGIGVKILNPSIFNYIPICWACEGGKEYLVEYLLKDKRGFCHGIVGISCIHYAVKQDNVNIATMLFKSVTESEREEQLDLLLYGSGQYGSLNILKMALANGGMDRPKAVMDCLFMACRYCKVDVARELLKDERFHNITFEICTSELDGNKVKRRLYNTITQVKNKALRICITKNNRITFDDIMNAGQVQPTNRELIKACKKGMLHAVIRLLDMIEDLNQGAPLLMAVEYMQLGVVQHLLRDPRIDPNILNGGALVMACYKAHSTIVGELLNTGKIDPIQNIKQILDRTDKRVRRHIFSLVFAHVNAEEFKKKRKEDEELNKLFKRNRAYLPREHW